MKRFTTILVSLMLVCTTFGQTVKIGAVDYSSISDAIAAAAEGEVIDISGLHTETISIDKNITLRGTDPATDIIQAAIDQSSATSRVIFVGGDIGAETVTIENLTIRHGNAAANGGGVFADKVRGLLSLRNVTITTNISQRNGGGLGSDGSNVNIEDCTIENNTANGQLAANGYGGGLFIAPNNAAGIEAVVNIKNSVINNNESPYNRGGGFYINGNHQYGDQYTIAVNFENVTLTNNHSAKRGGAGFTLGVDYTGFNVEVAVGETNTTLNMVHCTVAYNTSDDVAHSGLAFGNGAATTGPHFSLYNSIVVGADVVSETALNFTNSNTHDIVNCVLGGLNEAPAVVDEVTKNNVKGRTSTEAGIATLLSDEGGSVKVLKLIDGASAIDFCTAPTGINLPLVDARGFTRDNTPDAGAYEYGVLSALGDISKESPISVHPNPAITSFNVDAEKLVLAISLFDISGQLVKQVFNVSEMNVADVKAGLYLVEVKTESTAFVSKLLIK